MNKALETIAPTVAARTASVVLHPFVVPVYIMAVLLFADTAFASYAMRFKIYLMWVAALYTLVIPVLSLLILHSAGRLRSLRVDEREDRIVPLAVGSACYILCAITIGRIPSAELLHRFMLAAACCEMMCLAVSYVWKISLHLTAMGGCVALFAVLAVAGIGNLTPYLAAAVLAAGALASSRLYLGCHNLGQVAGGFFGGFFVAAAALLLL